MQKALQQRVAPRTDRFTTQAVYRSQVFMMSMSSPALCQRPLEKRIARHKLTDTKD